VRKAQLWSLDFVMSLLIFMSALLAVMFAWNYIGTNAAETRQLKELQLKALTLSDSLIRTGGLPDDWDEGDVVVIGLAQEENVLNATKVDSFINLSSSDHSRARGLLDMGLYDFLFEITEMNGTVFRNTSVPIGADAEVIVPVERYCLLEDRIVKARLTIWG